MKRTFLLACATVVTLGISAASSTPAHARRCSDADTDREEAVCLIRGAVYKAKAAAAQAHQMQKMQQMQQAQQMQAARAQQQAQQAAAAPVTKPTATSSPPEKSCGLTKEYVEGAVKFRDTCTGEWAQQDNTIQPKKAGL
jgi:membrane protease subunit (stomatin/prohibitin family)